MKRGSECLEVQQDQTAKTSKNRLTLETVPTDINMTSRRITMIELLHDSKQVKDKN